MKKNYLLLIFVGLLCFNSYSQEYIDYKIRTDDFYAQCNEDGNLDFTFADPNWHFRFQIGSSYSADVWSDYECVNSFNSDASGGYQEGEWFMQELTEWWSGKCLNNADNLYIGIEGWEDENETPCVYTTSDDDYSSNLYNYDTDLSNYTRNTWADFQKDDGTDDFVECGTPGTEGYYKILFDVWWNYSIPVVECNTTNESYGSFDINISQDDYRVTSWYYEVDDEWSFQDLEASGTTSASSISITGLNPSTDYYIRIKATNEAGTGDFSPFIWALTEDGIAAPDGEGTEVNPYQIANLENLNWLVQTSSAWDKYFIQTANIDASGTSGWNSGKGISKIGNTTTKFSGTYDGGGHTITGLSNSVSLSDYSGLFGYVRVLAVIKNLGIINANYFGSSNTGLLAGKIETGSAVINCSSSGTVDGHQKVGGLIGSSSGSNVTNSNSTATVSGSSECGGLIGATYSSSVSNSYATGNASADGTYGNTGGLIGYFHNNSNMINCYSTGSPSVVNGNIGGLVGQKGNPVSAVNSFWDTETSGQAESDVGIGKTSSEMKTQSTFTSVNWDFTTPIWSIDGGTNNGYPNLENNTIVHLWVGNSNPYWNTTENWSTGTIPTSNDDVFISDSRYDAIVFSTETADCKNLTIYSGASLTVESGASIIPTGSITNNGTFNMEHSMTDGDWHFVSSPVEGATANMFYGDYLQYYDETLASNNYVDIENENMAMNACKGFSWRNYNKSDFTFTGTPHHGNQSIATTAVNEWGWNLVGNPYPSYIDWDLLSDTYNTAIYIWTGSDTEFSSYNTGGGTNGGTNEIPPVQGFLMTTSAPSSFAVSNSHRIHPTEGKNENASSDLTQFVKLKASSGVKSDELFIQIGDKYFDYFDNYDAFQILTSNSKNINLYSKSIDGNLSIDRRPECEIIQLGIKAEESKKISIAVSESDYTLQLELEDTKLNTFHDLSQGAYEFDWNTTDSEERFILHLKATATQELVEQEAKVYSHDGQVYILQTSSMAFQTMQIFDLAGRVVYSGNLNQDELQSIHLSNSKGAYLVQLNGDKMSQSEKVILN